MLHGKCCTENVARKKKMRGQKNIYLQINMSINDSQLHLVFENPRVREILANTSRRGYDDIREHQELKELFIKAGVINEMTDFDELQSNTKIAAGIVLYLAAGLPNTIEDSIYAKPYMSDFDFKNRCTTYDLLVEFVNLKGLELPKNILDDLFFKKRRNMNAWLIRKKDSVIFNFGLEGTYDVNKKKTPTKPSPLHKTADELKAETLTKAVKLFADSNSPDIPEAVFSYFVRLHIFALFLCFFI